MKVNIEFCRVLLYFKVVNFKGGLLRRHKSVKPLTLWQNEHLCSISKLVQNK